MENKSHPQFIVVDLFCGAGGTSKGFDRAKYKGLNVAEVIACVNHDKQAIRNHSLNFPRCVHFTEDVRNMDFGMLKAVVRYYRRKYPNAKLILWASLECTHFSNAKTGSRSADSRTLAWILYEYQQKLQPDMIMVENVREFMSWGPLSAKVVKAKGEIGDHCQLTYNRKKKTLSGVWVPEKRKNGIDYLKWRQTIESRGYRYASRLLNSADFGSFQSRLRYFCVFARPGLPIVFPTPTHDKKGRHGLPKWNPVRKVLDLDEIGVSIFTKEQKQQYGLYLGDEQSQAQCRAKPLSPNTHNRIRWYCERGIDCFGWIGKGLAIRVEYRYLKAGEIIEDGDEVEMSNTIHDPRDVGSGCKYSRTGSARPRVCVPSEIPSPCMTAQQFEKKATTIGLKKGFLKDFQFVESIDARICCLLKTEKAIMLARNCNIEIEESPGGYLIYFLA